MSPRTLGARDLDLVIFDLDGVLADSSAAHAAAWTALFEEIGLEPVPYETLAGRPTLDVVREWTKALQPDSDQIERWVRTKQESARQALRDAPVTFPDTAAAVRGLRAAGLRLSVGTGASAATAALLLERTGVADAITLVVTAEDTTRGKPDPEVYECVLSRAGVRPERALVVEDSLSGLESARDAGTWYASVRSGVAIPGTRYCGSHADLAALSRALGVSHRG